MNRPSALPASWPHTVCGCHTPVWLAALAATTVLASACADAPGTGPAGPAGGMRLAIVGGDGQTGTVGLELPQPIVVRAVDSRGRAVGGLVVNFNVVAGGGAIYAGSAATNTRGEARDYWTLGTTAGAQRLEVRAVDPTTGAKQPLGTFTATAVAGPPTTMRGSVLSSGAATCSTILCVYADVVGGYPLSPGELPRVHVSDAYGNPVSGVPITFTYLDLGSGNSGGSISGTSQTTDAQGTAQLGGWLPGTAARSYEAVRATSAALPGVSFGFQLRIFAPF